MTRDEFDLMLRRDAAAHGIYRGALKVIAAGGPSLAEHRHAAEYARHILDNVESFIDEALARVDELEVVASSLQAFTKGEQSGRTDA